MARHLEASHMMEPMFPLDSQMLELTELASDVRLEANRMLPQIGSSARRSLALLLRAMNSYYSNKIEGQHTYPADLEKAIADQFSNVSDIKRRQVLAVAHMQVEMELEEACRQTSWRAQFGSDWVVQIHAALYGRLDPDYRVIEDKDGNVRGEMSPGEVRKHWVEVGSHRAPDPELVQPLLNHFQFRYGVEEFHANRKLVSAGCALHRLSWIHPFPDGNGRVSRLHNHLLLHHLGLTEGLWSPMRGLARKQAEYYQRLHEADLARRNPTDGRGSLSAQGLTEFVRFWLEICLDQIRFMGRLLSLETMHLHYQQLALLFLHGFGEHPVLHHRSKLRPELLGRAMHRLFFEGKLERGEFKAMLDTSDRTASRIISQLTAHRLIASQSKSGHLEPGFPFYSFRILFPGLWPEAESVPLTPGL